MFPYRRLPTHITGLYIFTVVNFLALFHSTIVQGTILVKKQEQPNDTVREIRDIPALFGKKGSWNLQGLLVYANPSNGCSILQKPPNTSAIDWIVLIRRYDCDFDMKVRNAQQAGYSAAIIHNVDSDQLDPMGPAWAKGIYIPSVFIGQTDGIALKEEYTYIKRYFLYMDSEEEENGNILGYLIAFACIMGFIFLTTVTTLIVRYVRDLQQRRRHQLSPHHLKKLPVKKFEKGDIQYETCAICLEDYMDGDKMRILPCSHAYHTKCIDPWLTKSRRTCPVCKRRVFTDGEVSDSEDDSDDDESTPLLNPGNQPTTSGNTFNVPHPSLSNVNIPQHPAPAERAILVVATNITSMLPPSSMGMSINLEDRDIIHTSSAHEDDGPIAVGVSASMDSDIIQRQDDSPIQIGVDAASASLDIANSNSSSKSDKEHVLVV